MPLPLHIHPPLLNTACPWATTQADLAALLACPSTGAITTRTSMLSPFAHDDAKHRFVFFDATVSTPGSGSASINSLGYSPLPLSEYMSILKRISTSKTVIISVTGPPGDIKQCYDLIVAAKQDVTFPLAMEINLSCPNIENAPPPGYEPSSLTTFLYGLPETPEVPVGVKVPPYTWSRQFDDLVTALESLRAKLSFVTSTNTLGNCLVLSNDESVLPSENGTGGMAGPPLHPLALGNVATLRKLLDESGLSGIQIIGVGGVRDGKGYKRMRKAGAAAVGLATGLGTLGIGVFEAIETDISGDW